MDNAPSIMKSFRPVKALLFWHFIVCSAEAVRSIEKKKKKKTSLVIHVSKVWEEPLFMKYYVSSP